MENINKEDIKREVLTNMYAHAFQQLCQAEVSLKVFQRLQIIKTSAEIDKALGSVMGQIDQLNQTLGVLEDEYKTLPTKVETKTNSENG